MNVLPVHIQYKSMKKSVPRGTLLIYNGVASCVATLSYLPNFTNNTLISAGDTPGMREA